MEYGSRVSNCKQCEVNSSTNVQTAHDCRMNWGDSAKAVEADLEVELWNMSKNGNYRVSQLICEDDATTIAKVGLTPGKVRSSVCQRKENIFEKRKVQSSSLEGKRKRM